MLADRSGANSPIRVLIVEDEALLAEELHDRIQRMSMQVVGIASSAEQAIALSARLSPDLVLMDVQLKGSTDGIQAATAIRAHANANMPVIYLTAHADDDTLQRARETSPFGYLVKPIDDRDLRVAIMMALHKSRDERRLRDERDDLSRSYGALQDFTSLASHDLRTPLFNITSLVDLIREDGPLSPDQEEYVQLLRGTATRMSATLESLLGLARLQQPEISHVDLNITMSQVFADLHQSVAEAAASVVVEPLPTIEGDAAQLHRLFLNLAANALKFRRKGVAPTVSVKMLASDDDAATAHATIEMRDNGVGFPPGRADQLFQPFKRLHGPQFEGTGLGLAACAKIVAMHHGAISARSNGDGAIFTVRLPMCQPRAAA